MSRHDTVGKCKTTVCNDEKEISVVYVQTKVFHLDKVRNVVTLRNGGWLTLTTKTRINQAAVQFLSTRLNVFQKDHEWFVRFGNLDNILPFEEGMELQLD